MISRTAIILFLASAFRFAAVRANNSTEPEPIVLLRVIFNDGVTTSHKQCSSTEFDVLLEAVKELGMASSRRNLRTARELRAVNCGRACCENGERRYAPYACMTSYHPKCTESKFDCSDSRRGLSESNKSSSDVVVLDELFFDDENNDRSLTETLITRAECLARKKVLHRKILEEVDEVGEDCASLLLAPNVMECIAIMPDDD